MAQRSDFSGTVHEASASDAVAITPSDTGVIYPHTRGIYVGGTGDLTVVMLSGRTVLFSAVPAGALLPVRVDQVKATGTTATSIVGLF